MTIKETVQALCRAYDTRDPFVIAEQRGIVVVLESLGTVKGYYGCSYRQQVIHINQNLTPEQQYLTCCHELGHAVLHPRANTPFLRENTFFSVSKLELEANRFAVLLFCSDEEIREYLDYSYTIPQISSILGMSQDLVRYRIDQLD